MDTSDQTETVCMSQSESGESWDLWQKWETIINRMKSDDVFRRSLLFLVTESDFLINVDKGKKKLLFPGIFFKNKSPKWPK